MSHFYLFKTETPFSASNSSFAHDKRLLFIHFLSCINMNNSRRTKKKRRSLFDLSIKPLNILSTSDRTTSFCFYDSFSELDATTSQRQLIAQYYFFSAACLTSFAVQASSQHFSRSTLFFRGG